MRLWKTVSLTVLAIVIAATGYGLVLVRRGFSARDTPSMVEKFAATTARTLAVPSRSSQIRTPIFPSPENTHVGMEHFADHCATCHSNDSEGSALVVFAV